MGSPAFSPSHPTMASVSNKNIAARRRRVCCYALVTSALIIYAKELLFSNSSHDTWSSIVNHRSLTSQQSEGALTSAPSVIQQPPPLLAKVIATQGRKQLEFIHITKTGGSAIERAAAFAGINWGACRHYLFRKVGCLELPDLHYNASNYNAGFNGKPFFGESWHCPHHWMNPNPHQGKATFCVIRNPYDRYVSEYGYMEGTISGQSLDASAMNDFIQAMIRQFSARPFWPGHFLPLHYYVYDETGAQVIDHVIRYENIQNEFHALMDAYTLDIVLPPKPQVNGFSKKQLTRETIAAINEYAKRDFELFGYTMVTAPEEFS